MKCVVTAGPTYEELDEVRRLANFSTGRLGSELSTYLSTHRHEVHLLLGHYSTWRGQVDSSHTQVFTTTEDLRARLEAFSGAGVDAIFHAAAVSDFKFGKIHARDSAGELHEIHSPKISTRGEKLFAELVPTPKILPQLRKLFPQAVIVGWKYELAGSREDVLTAAHRQIIECQTNACVANGRAYGKGFGILQSSGELTHCDGTEQLFSTLADLLCR